MTWKQQLADSITTPEQLAGYFDIDPKPLRAVADRYPLLITPHYFSLIETPGDPIWRQCVPDLSELAADDLPEDSLNEQAFAPVPAVVHRYPDRALLMVSGRCAGYCRFCTRKSRVGTRDFCFAMAQIKEGIGYISETPEIRDVILTGGDPLLLDDDCLADILTRIQQISHVEMVRIGSRIPWPAPPAAPWSSRYHIWPVDFLSHPLLASGRDLISLFCMLGGASHWLHWGFLGVSSRAPGNGQNGRRFVVYLMRR